MAYKVMIDPGHGGKDPGAVFEGRQEKDDALRLALAVGEILQNRGVEVEYTRTTDVYESPFEKAMEGNEAEVDFFVSIHRNSYPEDNVVSGVEVLVYDKSGVRYQMAENIADQLESTGFVNLGVKERPNLIVLKRTRMPAVLVEAGFMNSDTDNQLFDQNFEAIAQAIADGILDTLQTSGSDSHNTGTMVYRVQTGAFRNPVYARRMEEELLEEEYPVMILEEDGLYRVQVGNEENLNAAAELERRLKQDGYATVIVSSAK